MKVKCPDCLELLSEDWNCQNGHSYRVVDGILRLMSPDFERDLKDWLRDFEAYRKPGLKELHYEELPESGICEDPVMWKARQLDLKIIRAMNLKEGTALDIGSWNGWLAHRLTKDGLRVTAVDYFTHHLDGMGAKKHYRDCDWFSIQMDLENLSLLATSFDIIVVNRCFPYFTDSIKMAKSCLDLLKPGGKIIMTGLNLIAKDKGTRPLRHADNFFQEKYGRSIQFKPFKGFVDASDLEDLKNLGFKISLYPNFRNRIKGLFRREASFFAIYSDPACFTTL